MDAVTRFLAQRRWSVSSFILTALLASVAWVSGAPVPVTQLPPAAEHPVDFAKEIQPLLLARCSECHGEKKHQAGLRLDRREALLSGGDSGPAIVPGKGSESLLLQVLIGAREDIARMPKRGEALNEAEIGLLRAWIDQGAVWAAASDRSGALTAGSSPAVQGARHWAFRAPTRPPVPAVAGRDWVNNPIDAFILAALEGAGLHPSPRADRTTLLRRLSLDLIGLPPTIGEIDAFLLDNSSDAYERQVERLLKSPHYGERWGRHWLDAARYADSDGFEKDKPRFIWQYRDWVIQALNRDLPYNRFIIEQIAGDELPEAGQDQLVATGFLRNAMWNEEGGVDPEQFRMDGMFDRMDCIGKTILGLTIQCAQCHNHKFDPISQEEYYRLFAFLNNDHESSIIAYTPPEQQLRADLLRQIRDLEAGLRHTTPDWEARLATWENAVRNDQPEWSVVECRNSGDNGERFYYYADGSIRAASYAPTKWTALFKGTNQQGRIAAFRLEQLTDPNLPASGPGRSIKGMSALSEFNVEAADAANPTNKLEVKFVQATADYSNPEKELEAEFDDRSGKKRLYGPVAYAIDGKDDTAWGIDAGPGRRNQARKAVFVADKPLPFINGVILTFKLKQTHGGWNSDDNQNHNLGRFRLAVTSATNAVADPLPAGVRQILKIPKADRTPAQMAALFSYWRTTRREFKEANEQIDRLWQQWPEGAPTLTLAAVRGEGPGEEKRPTHIFKRGDWLKPGPVVNAGVPRMLHPLPEGADESRLTLAKWLVDRRSPTTARVLVNRVWQTYFGTGLVETPEDFGLRSPTPSHPELLDWLAVEFMERGWSMKQLHRLIVQSATYQQASRVTPELLEKDAFNRLLARGPRFRVEAEIVRDLALAASGLLNDKVGGPSVMPPAPGFLFQPPASYGPKVWNEEMGPDRFRRGIYTFRFRSVPYPVFQAFDAPNGDFSCVRRLRSNTPLQALTSLNETLFVECAQALAARTLAQGGPSDDARVEYAFRSCLARKPSPDEKQELLSLLERQKKHLAEGWVSVPELATGQNELAKPLPKGVTPTQLAAYTVVSRVLLNLDETITKE